MEAQLPRKPITVEFDGLNYVFTFKAIHLGEQSGVWCIMRGNGKVPYSGVAMLSPHDPVDDVKMGMRISLYRAVDQLSADRYRAISDFGESMILVAERIGIRDARKADQTNFKRVVKDFNDTRALFWSMVRASFVSDKRRKEIGGKIELAKAKKKALKETTRKLPS